MIKLQKILFPTDFSRCADQALTHAVFLAEIYGAELHILHVVTLFEEQPDLFSSELDETEKMIRIIEDKAEKQLNKIADASGTDDMKIITSQKRAISVALAILEYASDNDIDLIVMGTHGRRGLEHIILGSAAEEVVRLSKCPVFTIRETEEVRMISSLNNILVPIDFSEHSKNALLYSKEIADSYKADLQLLHIIEDTMHPAFSLTGKSSIFDLVPGIEEDSRNRIVQMAKEAGLTQENVKIIVKGGKASHDIIKFAADNPIDLIIIATHGLTGLEHFLLGSVTEKVVRRAPCPVFTVKAFGKSLLV